MNQRSVDGSVALLSRFRLRNALAFTPISRT